MIKEILREICNYFEDVEHDKALSVLHREYGEIYVQPKNFLDGCAKVGIYKHKEGSIWHYIRQGVYSYLAKKRRELCKK